MSRAWDEMVNGRREQQTDGGRKWNVLDKALRVSPSRDGTVGGKYTPVSGKIR